MWQLLRRRELKGYKFRRQHPLGPYIVDFVCVDQRLIVELDGGQHAEQAQYDSRRSAELEAAGYRVIRFWDSDVLKQTESVVEQIFVALRTAPHPNPLPVGTGRGDC
jgi:adenine-specific DNA-methyltransferase